MLRQRQRYWIPYQPPRENPLGFDPALVNRTSYASVVSTSYGRPSNARVRHAISQPQLGIHNQQQSVRGQEQWILVSSGTLEDFHPELARPSQRQLMSYPAHTPRYPPSQEQLATGERQLIQQSVPAPDPAPDPAASQEQSIPEQQQPQPVRRQRQRRWVPLEQPQNQEAGGYTTTGAYDRRGLYRG